MSSVSWQDNTFGGLEIELHPRKRTCPLKRDYFHRKCIFQPLIFRGACYFPGEYWWKRFLHHLECEGSMLNNQWFWINGKLKRVQLWILCDIVLVCFAWSEYHFRLKLKKFYLSTSINVTHAVHVSCAQVFVDLLFWSPSSSRWLCFVITCCFLKVSLQLCCLFWGLYSPDSSLRAKCQCLFLTSHVC